MPDEPATSTGTTGEPPPTASTAKPGVTKIVKLGEETLLITRLKNGGDVEEGEYTIEKITAVPVPAGPGGAAVCGSRCDSKCTVNL